MRHALCRKALLAPIEVCRQHRKRDNASSVDPSGDAPMNYFHRKLCSSARWKEVTQRYSLPWTLEQIDLGSEVLEVGPGYGVSTEVLLQQVQHLTCVESDPDLAVDLQRKLNGNVNVRCEDATSMSLPSASFDGAVCFSMLHHVGSV